MSDNNANTPQLSAGEAIRKIGRTSFGLSAVATLAILASMPLPLVGVTSNMGFGQSTGALSGLTAAGWVAWLTLVLYILATAARRLPAISAYRNLIDAAALLSTVAMAVKGYFFNPVRQYAGEMKSMIGGIAPRNPVLMPDLVNTYPHIGMALLLGAMVLLFLSKKRA